MTIRLKQSTASQEIPLGYFVDSTDGNTEETALTIANTDIKLWKTGATTLASKNSGGATHISNGVYYAVLDATDTDTLGPLVIFVHVTGALPVRVECEVLAANIFDSLVGGGDVLDVSVTQWLGTAAATPTVAGVPEVDVTHVAGATTDVSALATNVAAILVDTAEIGAAGAGLTALASAAALATVDGIADNLVSGIIFGAAATGTLSSTVATSNLTGYADDQLIGRVIIWLTGACEGEASDITDYASLNGTITFTALTTAPGNGDTFKIV